MGHLSDIDLARLVDEPPTAAEAAHLEECASCGSRLEVFHEQTLALSLLEAPVAGAETQRRIRDRVLFEAARGTATRKLLSEPALRVAAGILLFVGGTLFGAFVSAPDSLRLTGATERDAPVGSLAEAAEAVSHAEAEYLRALTRFAELTETGEGLDPVSRLAALEGIVLTTRAALREAPADPVINNYHLTAVGQRDALLRQIQTLAAGDEWF